MKILYFSLDYTPHDHRFLSALAETEHEVYYLRLQRGNRQVEDRPVPSKIKQIPWLGGKTVFRWKYLPTAVLALRRMIRELKPDLVHAGPIQTCAFIAALVGFRPLLTMSWGFDLMQDANRNAWWKAITRYTLTHSTFFISDAEITRQKAVNLGMDPQRTVVFPWGADLAHYAPDINRHSTPIDGFTFFCNRSWEPRYGVDVLVKAFVKASQQNPSMNLLLLGGGSQATSIRQIIEHGGVAEKVTFAGTISQADLPRYYNMANLYISPSHVDGSSVSLMEALACGLPCLVSDIPANKEWITDGVNGWLFPDGDVDSLATKMLKIVENQQGLSQVRQAARSTAEAKADWKKNFQKLLDAYELTTTVDKKTQ